MAADQSPRVPAFYEHAGLNSETYDARTAIDAERGVLAGDVDFYLALARETGGPVLDLGGGTGRVAVPLARAGFHVVSLDSSAAMQAASQAVESPDLAADGRLRFVQGDMRDFQPGEQFALVVIPFRGFQVLLDPTDQRACLASIHRHLRPGGLLAFHMFDPLLELCTPDAVVGVPRDRGTVAHPVTANEVRIQAITRTNDPLRQVMEEIWEFVETDGGGEVLRRERGRLTLRWTNRFEMRHLLELAGCAIREDWSDFHGSAPAYGKEQIYVAVRSA